MQMQMILMRQKIKVSYAICVHNETTSLELLLNLLLKHIDKHDEIVIVDDFSTNKLTQNEFQKADVVVHKKLTNNFASQKNLFFDVCSGDYIFNIDADELPSVRLICDVKSLCKDNPNIDLFMVPRENYIKDISKQQLSEWGWVIDTQSRINYPDYQGRIYKNSHRLSWTGCVHEHITGNIIRKRLSENSHYYINHTKSKSNQIKSNKLYTNIRNKTEFLNNFEIGIVCCYFNPCNYLSRFLNYIKFIDYFKQHGIPILTVESYDKNSKYRINDHVGNVISVKSKSIYWQKEALLNIGIKFLLKTKCKYIMWVDADIKFTSDNWYEKILNSTKFYEVTQIFKTAHQQNFSNGNTISKLSASFSINNNGVYADELNNLLKRNGEPGYGYCYHRDFFKDNFLFDKAILGTGDFLNLIGIYYNDTFKDTIQNDRFFKNTTNDFIETYCNWAEHFSKPNINVGYVDEDIVVMNHGSLKNRQYTSREEIIKKHKYTPSLDLKNSKNGIYQITNKKLEVSIKKYFKSRNEDEKLYTSDFTADKKFKKENISGHDNYYISKLKYLSDFRINIKDKFVIVSSTKSDIKLPIKKIKTNNKVSIDSSISPSIHSHIIKDIPKKQFGHFFNYIKFIIEFYDKLPEMCIFINTSVRNENYCEYINEILSSDQQDQQFLYILNQEKPIKTNYETTIRDTLKFKAWWEGISDLKYNPTMTYTKNPNFLVSRDLIKSNKKSFYVKLIKLLKSDNILYEFLLERTCQYIFK